jgi:hypothetical protein
MEVLDWLASQPLIPKERQFDQAALTFYATALLPNSGVRGIWRHSP